MAIITDFRSLQEEENARQRRIEENQQILETMASEPTLTADEARHRSAASNLGKEIINNSNNTGIPVMMRNGEPIDREVAIREITADALNAKNVYEMLLCNTPGQALAPFDWSNRIKACNESIIPFEHPVIRFTDEVPVSFAGPITLIEDKNNQSDSLSLYYRKRYVFMSMWDFCLFMAGTKKFHTFYSHMLDCKDTASKHIIGNHLMKELRKTETFNFSPVNRRAFILDTLSKSTYLGDHVGFHILAQLALMNHIADKFTVL